MRAFFQAEGGGFVTSSDVEGVSSRKLRHGGHITRNLFWSNMYFFRFRGGGLVGRFFSPAGDLDSD